MDALPDITPFQNRLDELAARIADPGFYANPRAAAEVTRERQRLEELVDRHRRFVALESHIAEAAALLRDQSGDADLRELAAAELPEMQRQHAALHAEILRAMIPPDPTDSRNTVLEIRAGTGGDEASLFAAELHRAYVRYAEGRGWKVQPMSSSAT